MSQLGHLFRRVFPGGHVQLPSQENLVPPLAGNSAPLAEPNTFLCSICSTLDLHRLLRDGVPKKEAIPIGSLVEILGRADRCGFCHLVTVAFQQTWLLDKQEPDVDLTNIDCSLFAMECGWLKNPVPPTRELCHRICILPSNRPQRIYDVMLAAQSSLALEIQLLETDAHKFMRTAEVHGRTVGEIIDIGLIRKWIGICEGGHQGVCGTVWWRGKEETIPGTVRMVDVEAMSVVSASPACRYIALSYLWGGVGAEYQTTQANHTQRATPGGLDISVLPASISDSIHLSRQLGIRYIWIDALCIIQDSVEDKAIQIGVMELIYGSSFLTVFAVGGNNAHAPLPGLRSGTRAQQQHVEVIQGLHLAVPLPTLREVLAQSAWGTRGWTYQELMLSSRRLFFTNQQMYFECGRETWCEDVIAESKHLTSSYHPLKGTGGGHFPPVRAPQSRLKGGYIQGYKIAIGQYTQRELTNESDTTDAISALTNAIAKGFKLCMPSKAFHYGMAIADLNEALLWQPTTHILLTRRHMLEGTPWPSWSWAGWRGAVQYTDILNGRDFSRPVESLINSWCMSKDDELVELDVQTIERITVYPQEEGAVTCYSPPVGGITPGSGVIFDEGTLVFRTTYANLWVERSTDMAGTSHNGDAQYAIFNILSATASRPVRAGTIFMPVSTESPSQLQCIVLSRTNGSSDVYDTDVYGNRYSGCFLYVMAVQPVGLSGEVERVGVGIIFEKAWIDTGAPERQVALR